MAHIQWKESYNINYKEIDGQHKQLLDILNSLLDVIEKQGPEAETSIIFHRLCAYALEHFILEESYLEACGYPATDRQKAEHRLFIEKILEFNERYDPTDPEMLMEIFGFLRTWFLGHVLRADMEYIPWVRGFFKEARIRGIIVDFEGVLSVSERRPFLSALAKLSGKLPKDMERLVFGDSLFADYQTGLIAHAAFLQELGGRCGVSLDEAQWSEVFAGMYKPVNEVLDVFKGLKQRFKLGLVANSNPWHAERIVRACPIFQLFDAFAPSFEARSLVPGDRIFKHVLDQLGLLSEECLFLTSRIDHAEAAERLLLHGQVFRGRQDVLKILAKGA